MKALTNGQLALTDDTSLTNFIQNVCGHIAPTHAKGLCRPCYNHSNYAIPHVRSATPGHRSGKATCHPNRAKAHSNGLCRHCYNIKTTYGVDFLALYNEQNGCCKSCGEEVEESLMLTDHDHKTMIVRGLLCRVCNMIVGFIENEKYDLAVDYLRANDGS